jgi:hypothetical protein
MTSLMVDIPVEPRQREAERLRTGQHTFAMRPDLVVYGQTQTVVIDFKWGNRRETPDLMEALNEAMQTVQQTTALPAPRRFAVDPDRIDELIDWALSQDWEPDEGERIRRKAWRNQSD